MLRVALLVTAILLATPVLSHGGDVMPKVPS